MLTNQLMNAIKPNLGMAKGPNETWTSFDKYIKQKQESIKGDDNDKIPSQ